MNLVLLVSIILAVQPLYTFGKSFKAIGGSLKHVEKSALSNEAEINDSTLRTRRNSLVNHDDADFLINKLSREHVTSNLFESTCNYWDDEVESDTVIEKSLRSMFGVGCLDFCRLKILAEIFDVLKCVDTRKTFLRDRRAKLDLLNKNDLFMPVRGRRFGQASPFEISAKKKAKLDVLPSDHFIPNRGRRRVNRKNNLQSKWNPFLDKRNNDIELNEKDFFVPNRGKRDENINEVFSDNFFPQRGKKVIIPKSHTHFMRLFQNIIMDDRNMIDQQQDLNQLMKKANKDITAAAAMAKITTTTTTRGEKLIPSCKNGKTLDKAAMILKPFDDEFTEILKTPDGEATNLIFTNTPDHEHSPNGSNYIF